MLHPPAKSPSVDPHARYDLGRVDLCALVQRAGKALPVALVLAALADERGETGPVAIDALRERAGCARSTAADSLATLKNTGLIESFRTHGASHYVLRFPVSQVREYAGRKETHVNGCPEIRTSPPGGVRKSGHLESIETRAHAATRLPTLPNLSSQSFLPSESSAAATRSAAAASSSAMTPNWPEVIASEFGRKWVPLAQLLTTYGIKYDAAFPQWSVRTLFGKFTPDCVNANVEHVRKSTRADRVNAGRIIGACRENWAEWSAEFTAIVNAEEAARNEYEATVLRVDPGDLRGLMSTAIADMPEHLRSGILANLNAATSLDKLHAVARGGLLRKYLAPVFKRFQA